MGVLPEGKTMNSKEPSTNMMSKGTHRFKGSDHVSHKLHQHIRFMLRLDADRRFDASVCVLLRAIGIKCIQMSHETDG